jgi:valyl-tRNA synthetase
MNVEPARRIQANLATNDAALHSVLTDAIPYVQNLARCEQVNVLSVIGANNNSSRSVVAGVEIELPLAGLIDVSAERARLEREIAKIEKELIPIQDKLNSPEFVKNAPARVVQLNQSRVADFQDKLTKLNENLRRIASL